MFKKNNRHLQTALISNVNDLPEKQRMILETSWSGVFFQEFHCRVDELPFAAMYVDFPSRPNAPVNELVSLEFLKAGNDWTDEEMYQHYLFDLQVRHALGLDTLGETHFEMRTVYNFRQRLSQYMQETGINLLDQAFEQVTDEQIVAFRLKTDKQRMDSTQVASNIRRAGRLQLLVEVLQRTHRMLNEEEQVRYAELFAPYVKGHAGQYIYRLKSGEYTVHMQQVGMVMQRLLAELKPAHGEEAAYQVLERVFGDHFKVEEETVKTKEDKELSATSLQSPDDLEATYRKKNGQGYQGYVVNLSETCDPENLSAGQEYHPLQLITKVQTAPNSTDDSQLLVGALPNLKERTDLKTIYTDGGHGGPSSDVMLQEQHVEQIQTAIRGRSPNPDKLHLADFTIRLNEEGKPVKITCPKEQTVPTQTSSQKKAFVAHFDTDVCQTCPLVAKCPARPGKHDGRYNLRFTQAEAHASQRWRRSQEYRKEGRNLRAAVEATVRSVKHPFPAGKLPVRGEFRVGCLMIGSAALTNVRRIQRYLADKRKAKNDLLMGAGEGESASEGKGVSFFVFTRTVLAALNGLIRPKPLGINC
jgi:hypothetical protein